MSGPNEDTEAADIIDKGLDAMINGDDDPEFDGGEE